MSKAKRRIWYCGEMDSTSRGFQFNIKKIRIKQNLNLSGVIHKENDYEMLHRKLSETSNKLKLLPCEIAP